MALQDVLLADGPATDRAPGIGLYGFLVGSWATEVIAHDDAGATHRADGEIHAGWVLEGRAIQDVWMIPGRDADRQAARPMPVAGNWYGTTLRIYDPVIEAWRIHWFDPPKNYATSQIGRAEGRDIVQIGEHGGVPTRWRFTEIAPRSFLWLCETSPDQEARWTLRIEVRARRA